MVWKVFGTVRSDKQEQTREKKEHKNIHKKFAPTLALKEYSRDLIGPAKLFDISAVNQNQGGKCIFSPFLSPLGCKKAFFTEGLSFGLAY